MARSTILGVGSYVPSRVVTNDDLAKLMTTSDEWIFQRSGIKERRFIEHSGIGSADLAVPACKAALEHAGLGIDDMDAIVFARLSSDYTFRSEERRVGKEGRSRWSTLLYKKKMM